MRGTPKCAVGLELAGNIFVAASTTALVFAVDSLCDASSAHHAVGFCTKTQPGVAHDDAMCVLLAGVNL